MVYGDLVLNVKKTYFLKGKKSLINFRNKKLGEK